MNSSIDSLRTRRVRTPAATLLVLREYESKGATTDTIIGLTGANNVICIVFFHALFHAGFLRGGRSDSGHAASDSASTLLINAKKSVKLLV